MKPTWNEQAEISCVGAVLLDGSAFDAAELEPGDFYHPRARATWEAFERLRKAKLPIDTVSTHHELVRHGVNAVEIGWLSECVSTIPLVDNVRAYAKVVRDDALTRRIRAKVSEALATDLEGEELLGRVFEAVTAVGLRQTDGAITVRDLIREAFTQYHRRLQDANKLPDWCVPTGFADLDSVLGGGLEAGVVTVLGGRPSMGKSSFARSIADNASAAGFGVHVFSLEDSRIPYATRALADHSRVGLGRLRALDLRRGDLDALASAAERLYARTRWLIDDAAGLSSSQIAMRVRRHKAENQTRVVVIDYVQLMREVGRDKRAEVERAAEGVVQLARAEKVAVILLSQLSRDNAKENRAPVLTDLRESGALEQLANAVLFVHRTDSETGPGVSQLVIAKNKHGERDVAIPLTWDANCATYRPAATRRDEPVRSWADRD